MKTLPPNTRADILRRLKLASCRTNWHLIARLKLYEFVYQAQANSLHRPRT